MKTPETPPNQPSMSAKAAITAIEQCLHWGGEEPYDQKRAQFIARSARRDCPRAVALAKERYPELKNDAAGALGLIDLTTNFASEYGAKTIIPGAEIKQVCLKAHLEVQRRLKADADEEFPYFELTCSRYTGGTPGR